MGVLTVSPPGYVHVGALTEVADTLRHGLRRLGADRTVVVGAHLLRPKDDPLPYRSIIFNSEHAASSWITPAYLELLRRHEVWDYSESNAAALAGLLEKPAKHVPLGYVPELTRIPVAADQDIDVLFYGSLNDRRSAILERLRKTGLAVTDVFGVYGRERDQLISRAKVVLNMHYYLPGIFEIVRVSYLMANRKAVVNELNPGEEIDLDLLPGIAVATYDDLPIMCQYFVEDDLIRGIKEQDALKTFATRDMTKILAEALR